MYVKYHFQLFIKLRSRLSHPQLTQDRVFLCGTLIGFTRDRERSRSEPGTHSNTTSIVHPCLKGLDPPPSPRTTETSSYAPERGLIHGTTFVFTNSSSPLRPLFSKTCSPSPSHPTRTKTNTRTSPSSTSPIPQKSLTRFSGTSTRESSFRRSRRYRSCPLCSLRWINTIFHRCPRS